MAYRQVPFAPNEWYHCYTRSVDKSRVFDTSADYERFLQALYLANSEEPIRRYNLSNPSHTDLLQLERGTPIVSVGAYCLMPNHFHILLQEQKDGGISKFMLKMGTSFSMYFNIKHKRVGNVFIKPFRAKHISDDRYLRRVVQYIHLNSAELFEPKWKQGLVQSKNILEKKMLSYDFSSLPDYYGKKRPESAILDQKAMKFLGNLPPLLEVLDEAASYYQELPHI